MLVLASGPALSGCGRSRYQVPPILDTSVTSAWPVRQKLDTDFSGNSEYASAINVINPYLYNPASMQTAADGQLTVSMGASLYKIASCEIKSAGLDRSDINDRRKEARNQLQSAIVRLSDEAFASHVARLKASEVSTNSTLGILATGLAGGASLATGGAASALSVAAAVTSGSRGIINEQEYRNALVESIILLLQADRRKALQEMHQNQTLSIQQYDVERAIADATDYHFRGSFYNGLALLVESARKSGNELEQSTLTLHRARSELAKLLAIGNNARDLAELFKIEKEKGVGAWLATANADQVGAALAYLRARQQEESQVIVKRRSDLKAAEQDLADLDAKVTEANKRILELQGSANVGAASHSALNQKVDAARLAVETAKNSLDRAEAETKALVENVDAPSANVQAAQARSISARTTLIVLESQLRAALDERDLAIAQSQAEVAARVDTANRELKELEDRRREAKARLETASRLYEEEFRRLNQVPEGDKASAVSNPRPPGRGE
jgi:hypothetical protein